MTITAQQILDIRDDFPDPDDGSPVFGDSDITRYWERTDDAQDDTQHHEAALALMYRNLLGNAAKLRDYSAGATGEKLSQVFDHVRKMYDLYLPSLKAAQGQQRQVAFTHIRAIPRQNREYPAGFVFESDEDDDSL